MHRKHPVLRDTAISAGILVAAVGLSLLLSGLHDDNNPFAAPVFILAVALIARLTGGYVYGILASLAGTFCVNYIFTYPFWQFNITLTGYPLTFISMLLVSVIISTLTTQIKRQEQLRYEMDREKMYSNLLRAIAHDIRTPLASILGAGSALRGADLAPGDREALLDGIERDSRWLVRVTENLLSVTRIQSGPASLKKSDEVPEEIIGSAIVKYRRTPGALPVQVDSSDCPLLVPMEGTLIEQVLINLFDNVSAHAGTASQIWLSASRGPGGLIIRVEDDGQGIPEERLGTLFDGQPRQDDRTHPDGRRSMGIGLSVCRSIIRAHGGEMTVSRSVRGGAAVSFNLPFTEDENEQSDPQ